MNVHGLLCSEINRFCYCRFSLFSSLLLCVDEDKEKDVFYVTVFAYKMHTKLMAYAHWCESCKTNLLKFSLVGIKLTPVKEIFALFCWFFHMITLIISVNNTRPSWCSCLLYCMIIFIHNSGLQFGNLDILQMCWKRKKKNMHLHGQLLAEKSIKIDKFDFWRKPCICTKRLGVFCWSVFLHPAYAKNKQES